MWCYLNYYFSDVPAGKIKLIIADADGNPLREFTSMDDEDRKALKEKSNTSAIYLTANIGWNRFVWNMRLPHSPALNGNDVQFDRMVGATVTPGDYQVTLMAGDDTMTQPLILIKDATSTASDEDLQKQFDLLVQIHDTYSQATETINSMRQYRGQLDNLAERLGESDDTADLAQRATALKEGILSIEKNLLIPDLAAGWSGRLNQGTELVRRLSALPAVVSLGEFPPTDQSYAVYDKLSGLIQEHINQFNALIHGDIAEFSQELANRDVSVIG